jgi:hypothetical protein
VIQSHPQIFHIQLVGGPDDGSTYSLTDLPLYWEMMSEHYCDQCLKIGIHTPIDSERYWLSNNMTPSGYHIYYHEGSLNLKAFL